MQWKFSNEVKKYETIKLWCGWNFLKGDDIWCQVGSGISRNYSSVTRKIEKIKPVTRRYLDARMIHEKY